MRFFLKTPESVAEELGARLKALRLARKWKRATLATRSGVTEASLRRFEQTGKVSLDNLLKLMSALGRIDEIDGLLTPPAARSISELEKQDREKLPRRGTI